MPNEKWISPYWVASHNNYRPAALGKLKFPKKLQLYDVTCRDGEQEPVVGRTAFGYEAGIAVMLCYGYKRANMLKYGLSYLPEFVGNTFSVTLGKKSGAQSVKWQLEELKYRASEEEVAGILAEVKREGIEKKRGLTREEFVADSEQGSQRQERPIVMGLTNKGPWRRPLSGHEAGALVHRS